MSTDKDILVEKVREFEARTGHTLDSWPNDPNNTASILSERRSLSKPVSTVEAKRQMRMRSRRGFLVGGAAAMLGILGWRLISDDTKAGLYRRAFAVNERVSQVFFDKSDLAPEFPRELATSRVNGMIGLGGEFDPANWQLQVTGLENPEELAGFSPDVTFTGADNAPRSLDTPPEPNPAVPGVLLSLDDIRSLPRVEMTTELKCIEGWSIIVNWTGARFSDFAARFFSGIKSGTSPDLNNLPSDIAKYVSLVTPDRAYYVGWDMQSILHPQTLLAYEMNGVPLKPEHGAPLRLVTTTKYGIKQIKRIGRIEFTNERPRDYWAENGYDWYSGH